MQIISHRGYWIDPREKNTEVAFRRSFESGYGTETDLRDWNGEVVISHDVPRVGTELMSFSAFLDLYREYDCDGALALNIKADGLQGYIKAEIEKHALDNYYLFDMSIPDTVITRKSGLNYLSRRSDLEPEPVLLDAAKGLWLDEFDTEWITPSGISEFLGKGKKVFVVSSELHGRDPKNQWAKLRGHTVTGSKELILCTDLPEQAEKYFRMEEKL